MKKIIILFTLTISSILLSACGGGGTTATDSGSSLTIVNADGVDLTVNNTELNSGISTACFADYTTATTGRTHTIKVVDSNYTWTVKQYSNDLTCTAANPTVNIVEGTYTTGDNMTVSSWEGGFPPTKAGNNSTTLPTNASFTILQTTVTSTTSADFGTVGQKYNQGFIIDDSLAQRLFIYNAFDNGGTYSGGVSNPYIK